MITETERLIVRLLTKTDVPLVAQLWTDERVTRFMGGPREYEKVAASLDGALAVPPLQFDLWPVVEKQSGCLAGHCGLLPKSVNDSDEVELVYVIAADHWGRGYATEAAVALRDYAFNTLRLRRLVSLIDPSHAASQRVAIKAGMTFESNTLRPSGKTMEVYAITTSASS